MSDRSGTPIGEHAWIAPGERPLGGIPTVTEKLLERLGY